MSFPAGPNSGTLGDWIDYTGKTVSPNYTDPTSHLSSCRLTLTATPSTSAGSGYHYVYKFSNSSGALTASSGDAGTGATFVPDGYQSAATLDAEIACDTLEYFTVEILRVDEDDNSTECSDTSTFGYHCVCSTLIGWINYGEFHSGSGEDSGLASLYLYAQTSDGYKVNSAVIDWGDGNSTTVSPAPDAQYYNSDAIEHTYSATGYYTVSVTFQDNATPTPNSYVVEQSVCICVPTSEQIAQQQSYYDDFLREYPDPALVVEEVGSVTGSGTLDDPYIRCYRAGLTQDVANKTKFVTIDDSSNYSKPNYFEFLNEGSLFAFEGGTPFTYKQYTTNDGGWLIGKFGLLPPCQMTYDIIPTPTLDHNGIIEFCLHSVGYDYDITTDPNILWAWFQIGPYTDDSCNGVYPITRIVNESLEDYINTFVPSYYYASNPADVIPTPTGCISDETHVDITYPTLPAGYNASVEVQQRQTDLSWVDIGTMTANASLVFDPAQPKIFRFVAIKTSDSSAVYSLANTIDTECEDFTCGDGFHDDGTGNCVNDDDGATACAAGYHWSGSACISNTPGATIPAPNGCVNSVTDGTATLVFQPLSNIPSDATSAVLQHWNGASYDDVKTLTLAEVAATFLYNLNPATILQFRWKLPTNDTGFQYTSDAFTITDACCDSEGGGGSLTPDVPDAPTVVKSCEDGDAVVSVVLPDGATSIEIARDDAENTVIATLTASGDFTDDAVVDFGVYKYRARAKNLLASDWSAWSAAVSFVSDTLIIAITEPAASAELVLRDNITFTLTDSNEPDACDNSDAPCVADADVKVFVDGVEATGTIQLLSGTPRNGTYQIKNLDSRYFANGAHIIMVTAKDINCCPAKATVNVTINNSYSNNIQYIVTSVKTNPPTGTQWYKGNLIAKSHPLHDLPQRRAWMRTAVATSTSGAPTWNTATDQQKADYFASLQRVKMDLYQPATTPDYDQLAGNVTLSPRGSKLTWVIQLTPYETQAATDTGLTNVVQFARVGLITDADAEYWALATGTNAAKIYQFVAGQWTEKFDLSDSAYDAADAISFTADANAVYVATSGGEIIAIDRDSGQATANIAPRGETRQVKVLFNDGAKVYWLFTDADLVSAQTKCYTYAPGNLQPAFTVDAVITHIKPVTISGIAMLAATDGNDLYGILGSNVATVSNTISDTITAIDANGDTYIVGTSTGKVYSVGETTTLLTTMSGAANDVANWNWDGEGNLPVAGTDSDILYEQSRAGAWGASHQIAPLSGESINKLLAFMPYEKTVTPAVGTYGEVGYVPPVIERKLFIGTGNDGIIVTLETSTYLQQQGSRLVSKLSHLGITPFFANL